MQNWNRFPRVILALSLLIALCAGLFAPRVEARPKAAVLPGDVVISEFRTRGPAGANDEFVELYNPKNVPVDISGLLIRGSSNAGTSGTRYTIPPLTTLESGQYYLIVGSSYSGSVTGETLAVLSSGTVDDGGFAITLADGITIIDQVGMSIGSAYKEPDNSGILPPMTTADGTANKSYERNVGGSSDSCQDTNNNFNDFELIAVSNPQNMNFPLSLCGVILPTLTPTNTATTTSTATITSTITATPTITLTPTITSTPTITPTATATIPPAPLSILINEVGWAGTALTPVDRTGDEWIELYNTSSTDINLEGWELRMSVNGAAETVLVTFGATDKILKNNFFILAREDSTGNYDIFNDVTENKPFSTTLPNTGSIVLRLYDTLSSPINPIDTANSGKASGWYAGTSSTSPAYSSMERRGKVLDGQASSWATFGGTPFAHNREGVLVRGTPGRVNWVVSITPTPTRFRTATVEPPDTATPVPIYIPPDPRPIINEILPRPGFDWNKDGRVDVFDEFVEIKNLTSISISLNGWRLDDELNLGSNPFALPDVTLNPGERIVFYASQTNILLSDGGDTVRLISPNGKIYDAYTYSIAKVEDQTICRLPDGNVYNGWFEDCVPTPNLNNSREGTVPVMPDVSYESPICKLPDTLPVDFLLAECRGYGANIWDADFWDQPDASAARYIPQNTSKWEAIIE